MNVGMNMGEAAGAGIAAALLIFSAIPAHADDTEGWLFVGRRSAEGWRPASPALVNPGYPVSAGQRLVIGQDALVYGSVDCKRIDAAGFKGDESPPRPVLRISADRAALEVLEAALECPSAGRAKTVWAKVKIPSARLVSQER